MGWIDASDGLLVRDLNNNGTIDTINELIGTDTQDAYTVLGELDLNGDGTINASDAVWDTCFRHCETFVRMAKQSSNNILTVVFADVFFLDCHVGLCPPRNDETFPISANDNHIKVKNVA